MSKASITKRLEALECTLGCVPSNAAAELSPDPELYALIEQFEQLTGIPISDLPDSRELLSEEATNLLRSAIYRSHYIGAASQAWMD